MRAYRWTLAALLLSAVPLWASPIVTSTNIFVPGTSDPYLAGMPTGSTASGYTPASPGVDTVPANSPVMVAVAGGQLLTFAVTGQAAYGPAPAVGPDTKISGPDGMLYNGNFIHHLAGSQNGLSDAWYRSNALVGVFLDANQPDTSAAPGGLDFRTTGNVAGGIDYLTLSPQLKQVFFIGDGLNSSSLLQTIVAPAGATRLYLGVADGWDWRDNRGGYDVTVTAVTQTPEPGSLALLASGLAALGVARRRRNAGK